MWKDSGPLGCNTFHSFILLDKYKCFRKICCLQIQDKHTKKRTKDYFTVCDVMLYGKEQQSCTQKITLKNM